MVQITHCAFCISLFHGLGTQDNYKSHGFGIKDILYLAGTTFIHMFYAMCPTLTSPLHYWGIACPPLWGCVLVPIISVHILREKQPRQEVQCNKQIGQIISPCHKVRIVGLSNRLYLQRNMLFNQPLIKDTFEPNSTHSLTYHTQGCQRVIGPWGNFNFGPLVYFLGL